MSHEGYDPEYTCKKSKESNIQQSLCLGGKQGLEWDFDRPLNEEERRRAKSRLGTGDALS